MAVIPALVLRRDVSSSAASMTPTTMHLLIALLVLFAVGFLCVGVLLILRSHRKTKQADTLAECQTYRPSSKISHRRVAATTLPINIYATQKEMLLDSGEKSPGSPVPEIRITFPEEDDSGHKRSSGRVVVVKISDKGGVGFEPYNDEHLPPYQKSDEKFHSLDLERMGGLKEKEVTEKARMF